MTNFDFVTDVVDPIPVELHEDFPEMMRLREERWNDPECIRAREESEYIWKRLIEDGIPEREVLKELGCTEEELKIWDRTEPFLEKY